MIAVMKLPVSSRLLVLLMVHLAIFQAIKAQEYNFGEDDYSAREMAGQLVVTVGVTGNLFGAVVLEVVPITGEDYIAGGYSSVPDAITEYDPAEYSDFNSEVKTVVLDSTTVEVNVPIEITNDNISEKLEVFLVILRVVNITDSRDEATVVGKRTVTVGIIRDDDASKTKIQFNMDSLTLTEGVGTMNDALYIMVEGLSEHTLEVRLELSDNSDIQLPTTTFTIAPSASMIPVPLVVADDLITEQVETFRITVLQEPFQNSLSRIGSPNTVTISIMDNDEPKVGFDETALTLEEGAVGQVCVSILEPQELETDIDIVISASDPALATFTEQMTLEVGQKQVCIDVQATDNSEINYPVTFELYLRATVYLSATLEPEIEVSPSVVTITVTDNDGIPKPPDNVRLDRVQKDDLRVRWDAEATKLQPIDQFVVVLATLDHQQSPVSKRQSVETTQKEYNTTEMQLILEDLDHESEYQIHVCAENRFGRSCSEDEPFTLSSVPLTGGGFPLTYIIIVAVLPVVLLLLCLFLFCLICLSCRRSRSKQYYPTKQEKKMEKTKAYTDGKYAMKKSPSTESDESFDSYVKA